jgi:hypothetical protein
MEPSDSTSMISMSGWHLVKAPPPVVIMKSLELPVSEVPGKEA